MRVGVVGLGQIGLPVCAALAASGYDVVGTDVRSLAEKEASECGAGWAGTPAEAAAGADVLITVLPGAGEVEEALAGPHGALLALASGTIWIDMTSNFPRAAARLQRLAISRGVRVLEAPVGGGPDAARSRQLQIFAGGDVQLLEVSRPVLESFADAERIVHVGGLGAGYAVKLLVNLIWFGEVLATAEALLIGQAAGVDVGVLRGVLASSAAGSTFIRRDASHLLRGDYLPSFGLDRICEELDAVLAMSEEYQVPRELTAKVNELYHRALGRFGAAKGELLAAAMLEEQAGRQLRAAPGR